MPKGIGYGKKALQGLGEKKKKSKMKLQGLQAGGKVSSSQKRGLGVLKEEAERTRPSGYSRDLDTHFKTVSEVTGALSRLVGPDVAGALMRGASIAGEFGDEASKQINSQIFGGAIPGLSRSGFDEQDLVANELGIQQGQADQPQGLIGRGLESLGVTGGATPQQVQPANIPRGQTGGALPQIAGVRIPTEDAIAGPAPQEIPGMAAGGKVQIQPDGSYKLPDGTVLKGLQINKYLKDNNQQQIATPNKGTKIIPKSSSSNKGAPAPAPKPSSGPFGFSSGAAASGTGNGGTMNGPIVGGGGSSGGAGGSGGAGLSALLNNGNPTDTTAIKNSNNALAKENFEAQSGAINESVGALGLGSSSARTREIGSASANLNAGLNASNSLLDFNASESGKNRGLTAGMADMTNSTNRFGITTGANTALKGFASNEKISAGNNTSNESINNKNIAAGSAGQLSDQNFKTELFNASNPVGNGSNGGNPFGVGGFQTGGIIPRSTNHVGRSSNNGGREDFIDIAAREAYGKLFNKDRVEFNKLKPQGSGSGVGRSPNPGGAERRRAEDAARLARNNAIFMQDLDRKTKNQDQDRARRGDNQHRSDILSFATGLGGQDWRTRASMGSGNNNASQFGLETLRANAGVFGLSNATGQASINRGGNAADDASALSQIQAQGQSQSDSNQRIAEFYISQGINPRTGERMTGRATGGRVPGSSAGGDTVPAEVGPADGQADVMLQGQEGIVPLDVMSELKGFQGDPGHAVQIINTLRDIMGHAPGPRGPEENAQGNNGRQVGGSVRSDIPVPAWRQTYQPPQQSLPVDRQRDFSTAGGSTFDNGTQVTGPNSFSIQGNPNAPLQSSGQVFVNGVDQSSQLASDQLQSAQFKRRAAFFEELMATTPQYAQERLAKRRDDALGQASLFDTMSSAELTRQSAETLSAGRDDALVTSAMQNAGGRQGTPQVTPQQLRTTITQAAENYSKLVANGQDPGVPREEYMHGYLVELGLGQYSPYADQVGRGAQSQAIQGLASGQRPPGANTEGPMFTGPNERDTQFNAQKDAIGENVIAGIQGAPKVWQSLIMDLSKGEQSQQSQLLKRLQQGSANTDDTGQATQLAQFYTQQAIAFGEDSQEGQTALILARSFEPFAVGRGE